MSQNKASSGTLHQTKIGEKKRAGQYWLAHIRRTTLEGGQLCHSKLLMFYFLGENKTSQSQKKEEKTHDHFMANKKKGIWWITGSGGMVFLPQSEK